MLDPALRRGLVKALILLRNKGKVGIHMEFLYDKQSSLEDAHSLMGLYLRLKLFGYAAAYNN